LKLKYDKLLSSVAFKFNLRHYTPVQSGFPWRKKAPEEFPYAFLPKKKKPDPAAAAAAGGGGGPTSSLFGMGWPLVHFPAQPELFEPFLSRH